MQQRQLNVEQDLTHRYRLIRVLAGFATLALMASSAACRRGAQVRIVPSFAFGEESFYIADYPLLEPFRVPIGLLPDPKGPKDWPDIGLSTDRLTALCGSEKHLARSDVIELLHSAAAHDSSEKRRSQFQMQIC